MANSKDAKTDPDSPTANTENDNDSSSEPVVVRPNSEPPLYRAVDAVAGQVYVVPSEYGGTWVFAQGSDLVIAFQVNSNNEIVNGVKLTGFMDLATGDTPPALYFGGLKIPLQTLIEGEILISSGLGEYQDDLGSLNESFRILP